jgi:hypothetical protein
LERFTAAAALAGGTSTIAMVSAHRGWPTLAHLASINLEFVGRDLTMQPMASIPHAVSSMPTAFAIFQTPTRLTPPICLATSAALSYPGDVVLRTPFFSLTLNLVDETDARSHANQKLKINPFGGGNACLPALWAAIRGLVYPWSALDQNKSNMM